MTRPISRELTARTEILAAMARCRPDALVRLAEMVRAYEARNRLVVYLAHPVGAGSVSGVLDNLARSKRWLWALRRVTEWSICAPWIPSVEAVLDSGAEESVERQRGLVDDLAVVERCDAIVLVGGRMSSGMTLERDHCLARGVKVVDLTALGDEPPTEDSLRAGLEGAWVAYRRVAVRGREVTRDADSGRLTLAHVVGRGVLAMAIELGRAK